METQKQPASPGISQECEHGWATASRHRSSLGTVAYRKCVRCGVYRVELSEPGSWLPASPLSRPVGVAGKAGSAAGAGAGAAAADASGSVEDVAARR